MSTRKNAVYNVAYRMFSIFLPLLTAPWLSRAAGQAGVGLYEYAWSISYVFCLVGMLGLENYGVRAIARVKDDPAQLSRTFSQIWRMQLLVAGATLLAYLGYVAFIAGEERTIAFHLTLMSVSCLVNLDWCLMGLGEFKPIALRNTAVKLMGAAAVFLLVRSPGDLWIYAFVWSLTTFLGCLSCWMTLRGRVRFIPVPWGEALKHLAPCALLFTSVIAVSVYRQMDKVMVGAMAGMAQNGLYASAEKIIYCLSGFISAIGTVMLPKATAMASRGEDAPLKKHLHTTMDLMLCMTGALAFGVAAVAEDFAPLFYGEDFAACGPLMIPLAFTLLLIGWANVIRTQWILPHGRDGLLILSVCTGAAVNLIANFLLIPRLGAMGAVIGTVLAEAAVPAVQLIRLRGELEWRRYLVSLARYALLGGAMYAIVRLADAVLPFGGWLALAAQVCLGAAVYGAGALLIWKATGNRAAMGLVKRNS